MKLKFIAASAAILASTGAYAQSSVTLYGVADIGIQYLTKADGKHSNVSMTSGNMSGSRWGLRGVEDLGGGLKSIFTLESGFHLDNGTGADHNRLFNRQAFVGLQGNFGTLTLGRQQTPLYDFGLNYDPMALSPRYSISTQDAGMAGSRADNAVKYVGTFSGLTVSALYSFGYQGNSPAGEVPGDYKKGREYTAGVNYASGPFSVGVVYDFMQPATTASDGASAKTQRAAVGGAYALGNAKVFAGYRWHKWNKENVDSSRNNLWWAGLGYQVKPALRLTGAVYYKDSQGSKADPWSFVASADYALSKRTDAYMNLGYALNRSDKGKFSTTMLDARDVGSIDNQFNQFGAVVGIRHKF